MKRCLFFLLLLPFLQVSASGFSLQVSESDFNCYTLIAGNRTTPDGSVMMAHNEDDGGEQMLNWFRVPALSHKQGETLLFRNGAQEPLPAETHGYLWLELPKMDVSDGYLNDRGVAIASDGCPSREDRMDITDGGMVYELRQLVAMQAASARHAVDIIGYLVEKYGYASSGRTYCVADAKEAWAVAVVQGRHWVAQRVPDHHVMALANTYNIDRVDLADRANFAGSADLITYAIHRGWYDPVKDGAFSFRKAYGAPQSVRHPNNIARAWFAICLLSGKEFPKNSDLPFSFEPAQQMTLNDMMEVLSSHYQDTPWKGLKKDVPHNTDNSICHSTTQFGAVFQLRSNMPVEIGSVAWIAPYHPCIHVFVPWYLGIKSVPAGYARYDGYATAMANHFIDSANFRSRFPDKIYWKLVDSTEQIKKDYTQKMETIRPQKDQYQKALFERQPAFEAEMIRLYQQDKEKCRSALTDYTYQCLKQNDAQEKPPGIIISHLPGNGGIYVGSPSICILPNGDYVASHDEFGPSSNEFRSAVTRIFHSSDKGVSWKERSVIQGLFWSNLFVHNNVLYNIGANKHHGNVVIRKSTDGGQTWTKPYNGQNGLLLEGEYHTAPVPMVVHNGRIWRAIEYATAPTDQWGKRYSAMVISAPVNADLLDAKNWRKSNYLMYDSTYLDGRFGAWLEGNVVISPEGKLLNILRVHVPEASDEYVAMVEISKDGEIATFNPATGFVKFPGGAKKFTIRYDSVSKRYWTIHNIVTPEFQNRNPSSVRNTLVLSSSADLKTWQTHEILLKHPDVVYHGFQYIDWQFEGNDIIYASRTAFDDATGGAHNAHDANYLTFHRIKDFRMDKPNNAIKKVHLIFKTHLDIGFTDLSSVVERQYIEGFIPKTLDIIDQLRAEGAKERYVWTTGSWLVSEYLKRADPEAVKRLEEAILRGDIVWNGVPYTVESEAMSKELFATCLKLSQQLDRRFGKTTTAAKMTDVPGHTRSIVTQLSDAGISLLHVGVNGASTVPEIPPICRWKNTDGKEIVLICQGNYGEEMVLPDGETVVSINFTGDNHGPHSIEHIKQIFANTQKKYPQATISATSLNEVARDIRTMMDKIPALTSEIGDTWIYGFGSSPLRIARYRALSRLYTQWVQSGKMDMNSPAAIDFAVGLGLVAEHTWGLDVKTHIKNWDKYDIDAFNAARETQPFKSAEQAWAEEDAYIDRAVSLLPASLQKEAHEELENTGKPVLFNTKSQDRHPQLNENGVFHLSLGGVEATIGELAYRSFSADDYVNYRKLYLRSTSEWALGDFGKPGLENSSAKSATVVPVIKNSKVTKSKNQTVIQCELQFAGNQDVDPRVFPESTIIEYTIPAKGAPVEMKVTFVNKPAVRLPEAYLLSFVPSGIQRILAEKMGFMVDVSDVVPGGNRQMHAIDNHIDLITDKGTFRITSLDAPFVVIGERNMLNYSTKLPELNKGVHFCLFNNLWGTNFTMWWEGSITYRFIIEVK